VFKPLSTKIEFQHINEIVRRAKAMTKEDSKPVNESLAPRPFSFAELVNYKEGSIVSRTIIDKPAVTITVFAFEDALVLDPVSGCGVGFSE
jgi:capsid portal protein